MLVSWLIVPGEELTSQDESNYVFDLDSDQLTSFHRLMQINRRGGGARGRHFRPSSESKIFKPNQRMDDEKRPRGQDTQVIYLFISWARTSDISNFPRLRWTCAGREFGCKGLTGKRTSPKTESVDSPVNSEPDSDTTVDSTPELPRKAARFATWNSRSPERWPRLVCGTRLGANSSHPKITQALASQQAHSPRNRNFFWKEFIIWWQVIRGLGWSLKFECHVVRAGNRVADSLRKLSSRCRPASGPRPKTWTDWLWRRVVALSRAGHEQRADNGNIRSMYKMMAKCEELSIQMQPIKQLQQEISDLKKQLRQLDQNVQQLTWWIFVSIYVMDLWAAYEAIPLQLGATS